MRRHSKSDLFRYAGNTSTKSFFRNMFHEPGYRYITYFRMARAYRKNFLMRIIAKLFLRRCSHRFSIQIPEETSIGEGLYIGHWGTIIINRAARIGKNCNITAGVTIGQANRGAMQGVPTIGDSVWIGNNATLVGNINVGNDVLIAPGAYVNFDVPDHSIVIGNPAVIKSRVGATDGYIENKI